MSHVNLEGIAENAWDINLEFNDRFKSFLDECKLNYSFEWKCIIACEAGDIGGTYAAAMANSDWSNEWGYLAGVLAGLGYAFNHVSNDARAHGIKPSFKDAAVAAGSAEIGCTTSATAIPYLAGKFLGASFGIPSWEDFGLRLGALPFAFLVGLPAMSSLTFPKKNEAGRIIANKGKLNDVADILKKNYDLRNKGNNIKINGTNSALIVNEQPLPRIYQEDFSSSEDSLYRIFTPTARYSEDARKSAEGLICRTFDDIGITDHTHRENPYIHRESHDHSSHSHNHKH